MSTDLQQILQSKDAERRRLRDLPWTEKLEILDRLRDRHLLLRQMIPSGAPRSKADSRD
ncbi:MAG: hypothetical protein PHC88_06245 [Terrimicrobiaceae bacterium]|nr:hypothetical protein [Terrimicrobiaceae bacterium]